jgi:hypothetical protein
MRKIIFFLASSLDARCWLSKSSDPFPCSKQYYMLCVSPLSFHIKVLLYQHGRSALDTSRTLFLLASTQGVSCRLVMNHLIHVYVLSRPPPHIYVSKCIPVCKVTLVQRRLTVVSNVGLTSNANVGPSSFCSSGRRWRD